VIQATLRRRSQGRNKHNKVATTNLRRCDSTFHQHEEKAILQRIRVLGVPTFGFKACDIPKLKSDLGEENEVWHCVN
jgi:hypothetical protein